MTRQVAPGDGAAGRGGPAHNGGNRKMVAYAAIKDDILRGGLAPGAPISEAERAAALGISRTPVREALQMLAAEGLVEIFPKRGTLVARLSARDVRESFELREAVEAACARLAAERRTDEDLAAMRRALHGAPSYQRGATFHRAVVAASGNRYLRQVFESTSGRIDLASRLAARAAVSSHHPSSTHEAVFTAIEAKDGPAAEEAMRRHLREHASFLIEQML